LDDEGYSLGSILVPKSKVNRMTTLAWVDKHMLPLFRASTKIKTPGMQEYLLKKYNIHVPN